MSKKKIISILVIGFATSGMLIGYSQFYYPIGTPVHFASWLFDYEYPIESFPIDTLNEKLNRNMPLLHRPYSIEPPIISAYGMHFGYEDYLEKITGMTITNQTYLVVISNGEHLDVSNALSEISGVFNIRSEPVSRMTQVLDW